MRSLVVFALGVSIFAMTSPAQADFYLNCQLMDKSDRLWSQHCKALNRVHVRIVCRDRLGCLALKKKLLAAGVPVEAIQSATGATLATRPLTTTSNTGSAVGNTVSGTSTALGNGIAGTGHGLGGAVEGAGGAVGGAVGGPVGSATTGAANTVGGTVRGAGETAGGAVNQTGSTVGGTISGAGQTGGAVVSGAGRALGL